MNNKPKCFIDFDGTIICNKERLYRFFIDNIEKKYVNSLTIEEFWNLKKMGINEIDWINRNYNTNLNKEMWNSLKSKFIEDEKYLKYNKLFNYSIKSLEKIKNQYNLILVTRRSNKMNLLEELRKYNLINMFSDVLVTSHNSLGKSEIIKKNYCVSNVDIMIGDTEDDLIAAKELDIQGILVKSGIRSEWIIQKYFSNYQNIVCFDSIDKIDFNKINMFRK